MTGAKELLLETLAAIPDGRKVASLFAEDGVIELPFLQSVGIGWRYQGHQSIAEFYDVVKQLYPDFRFRIEDTHVLIDTPNQVFAEYMAHTRAAATGRIIHHLFAARLVAREGKVVLLRESLNVVAAAQALLPGGLADLPASMDEIRSVAIDYRS